jgi:ADP-ribosyl-[dinitrogen reductase] hydrolase
MRYRLAAAAGEPSPENCKTVLLRCARYGASVAGVSPLQALEDARRVLPEARPNPLFMQVLGDDKSPVV